jgi:GntR family transcriptional repressor for pyruvate dehydrogenase complex
MSLSSLPSSREALMASLVDRITDGELSTGFKLPSERELAIASGLSRPIVREVLRGLEERGLVEIHPGRGSFVTGHRSITMAQSMKSFVRSDSVTPRDLIEARATLERQAAELAAVRATPDDLQKLRHLAEAFERSDDLTERARGDLAFHAMVVKAAHNPVLETMFGSIAPLVFLLQLRSLSDPSVVAAGAPLHLVVLDAIVAHDPDVAGQAMMTHVTLASEMYGADVDQSLDAISRRTISALLGDRTTLEEVIAEVLGPNDQR